MKRLRPINEYCRVSVSTNRSLEICGGRTFLRFRKATLAPELSHLQHTELKSKQRVQWSVGNRNKGPTHILSTSSWTEMENNGFMCVSEQQSGCLGLHRAAWPSNVRRTSHLIHVVSFFLSLVCESFPHFVRYSRHTDTVAVKTQTHVYVL